MRSEWLKISIIVAGWVIFISLAHYMLNCRTSDSDVVKIGYMPVISNLSVPLMAEAAISMDKHWIDAIKFSSFADMADALRHGQLNIGFMIAPLAIALRQQGVDIKICYIGNRHESTLVGRKDIAGLRDLADKTVAVPMRFSGHYLLLRELAKKMGFLDKIQIVEMNPPDMASALMTGGLDAYFVGEPFAAQSIKAGQSKVLLFAEDYWPDFICNVMVVRTQFLNEKPSRAKIIIEAAARAGLWAKDHLKEATAIASKWWGQPEDVVFFALNNPPNRVVFDKFMPKKSELKRLARVMVEQGLTTSDNIDGLIDENFCPSEKQPKINSLKEIFPHGF